MKIGIKYGLWVVVLLLAYYVYDSIESKIAFEDETKRRREITIEKLKDIRTAQLAFKSVKNRYANNFEELLNFVKNDSFPVIKALGTVPDTLSEEQAVKMGIVTRDTSRIGVMDSLFSPQYLKDHIAAFYIDSLPYIPFGNYDKFEFHSGEIEKGKVQVNVFEVFGSFEVIYRGLNTSNEAIDLKDGLRVGSMTDPSTSGNWGE